MLRNSCWSYSLLAALAAGCSPVWGLPLAETPQQVVAITELGPVGARPAVPHMRGALPAAVGAALSVTSVQAPSFAMAGKRASDFLAVVRNVGTADSGQIRVEFYIGKTGGVTTSDTDTGWGCTFTNIAAGNSASCGGELGVPPGISSGSYYIAAIADPTNTLGTFTATANIRQADTGPTKIMVVNAGIFDPSDGSTALKTNLQAPYAVRADGNGNLYIADNYNGRIRKVAPSGAISTILGNGLPLGGEVAWLDDPQALAMDSFGNLYVADAGRNRVLKVSASGSISVFAGNGLPGFAGDAGPATSAMLNYPDAICVDSTGNVYIADYNNDRIRRVSVTGTINTVATVSSPAGLAIDSSLNLYVSDIDNSYIRKITNTGVVAVYAGNGKLQGSTTSGPATSIAIGEPYGLWLDSSNNLYVTDWWNDVVWKVDAGGNATVFAGRPDICCYSGDGGLATSAALYGPVDIAFDSAGNAYIADGSMNVIRKVNTSGRISTIAGANDYGFSGDGASASRASLYFPEGMTSDPAGNIYLVDRGHLRVRKISPANIITTIAGGGAYGDRGDGGAATDAAFYYMGGVAVDSKGNVYIADRVANRVRKLTVATGIISTFVGTGTAGKNGSTGAGTAFLLYGPDALAIDSTDNLYIADKYNGRILRVTPDGNVTTFAGNGSYGETGDNGPATSATLTLVYGLATDRSGNLYIAQYDRIRKVNSAGTISAFAGTSNYGFSGDGGPATAAMLWEPRGMVVDASGYFYFVDSENERVRVITPGGSISTYLGNGHVGYDVLNHPYGLTLDPSGMLWVADTQNHRLLTYATGTRTTCSYSLSPTQAGYQSSGGSGTFSVSTSNGCGWTATTSTSWVHVSTPSGSGIGTVGYSVDANINPSSRTGTITAGGQMFTIDQAGVPSGGGTSNKPTIAAGGIVEPWTYQKGIAPGGWVSIYGSNLATTTASWAPVANQPLPTTLGGTTVTIDGVPAVLNYVSAGLVNALVPSAVPQGNVAVVVTSGNTSSDPMNITSTTFLPAIYSVFASGTQPPRYYVTAVNALTGEFLGNSSVDARVARAARQGDTVDLYAIGLGPTAPQFPTGTLFSGFYALTSSVNVVLNNGTGIPSTFAALVSPGLYQVRFTLPANAPTGDVQVQLDFGPVQTATSVYLTIAP
jgi:uncharacterized protein (TIGR03437 family)